MIHQLPLDNLWLGKFIEFIINIYLNNILFILYHYFILFINIYVENILYLKYFISKNISHN